MPMGKNQLFKIIDGSHLMRRNPCWGILIGRQENHWVVIIRNSAVHLWQGSEMEEWIKTDKDDSKGRVAQQVSENNSNLSKTFNYGISSLLGDRLVERRKKTMNFSGYLDAKQPARSSIEMMSFFTTWKIDVTLFNLEKRQAGWHLKRSVYFQSPRECWHHYPQVL